MFESVQTKSILCATLEELNISVPKLTNFYDEISKDELLLEIPRLRRHLVAAGIDLEKNKDWSMFRMLEFIAEWYFKFLSICVSEASCEIVFQS